MVDPALDPETGLQYLRARYYDPQTGQFLTRDPIEAQTRQPYSYANDNPVNNTDPTGQSVAVTPCYAHPSDPSCGDPISGAISSAAGWLYTHTSVSVGFCFVTCFNLGFQGGHFYDTLGGWGFATPGINIDLTTREFNCQAPYAYQFGGGALLGANGSVGMTPNGQPSLGDWQGGVSLRPGGAWFGDVRVHSF
ncbi:MAG: RHS repeat-associated core domain-containing protein [Solirubrobacteraceae bacterium]